MNSMDNDVGKDAGFEKELISWLGSPGFKDRR